ncbi:MAG: hypothetical protein HY282_08730 [Nitrospirae bacterium]|nr:hypothetical protein [Candidatus Manganitrophaceae bacterium]
MTSLRFGVRLTLFDLGMALPHHQGPQFGLSLRYRTQKKMLELWIGMRMTERIAGPAPSPSIEGSPARPAPTAPPIEGGRSVSTHF